MKVLVIADTHAQDDIFLKILSLERPFDALLHAGDFEGSELYIAEMDTNDFSLTDTLDEGVIFIEESLPEVLYRDVL